MFIYPHIHKRRKKVVSVACTYYIGLGTHLHMQTHARTFTSLNIYLHNLLVVFISVNLFIDSTLDFRGLYKIKWDPFLTRIVYTIVDSVLIQLKLNWVLINRR